MSSVGIGFYNFSRPLINLAAFHHEIHLLQLRDIGVGITGDGDDVRPFAGFDGAELVLPAEQFRMPDALWARIVYDFALAHRLRTINLSHLFGAFTPLYLGWAASYAMEIGATTSALADKRTEELAAAFEADKTYLLSRWRWPDRFNP